MRKRNFTLIEIMIVVAIIALLALIALPNFIEARKSARNTTCIANLKQIEGAKQTAAIQENWAESKASVSAAEINNYFTGGSDGIYCPLDSSKTMTNSYDLGGLSTVVTCKKDAANHKLGN